MNGLRVLELTRPSLPERLLRRKPKENAAIELNNYVANTPLSEITRQAVEKVLVDYKCDYTEAKPALTTIYAQVLNHFLEDRSISDQERDQLTILRQAFGLTEEDARAIDREALLPIYQRAVSDFYADQHLTFGEKEQLERLSRDLRLDEAEAESMALDEAYRVFEETTRHAASDRQPPPEEETES